MEEVQKHCRICDAVKDISVFCQNGSMCRECDKERAAQYRKTLNGHLHALYNHAKRNAKDRQNKNREDAGKFEMEFTDLENMYKKQKGLCFYSGIKMNIDRNDYKMSLERLNPDLGYIKDNIAFTCSELNNISQWSLEKIQQMLFILQQNITDNPANFELNTERKAQQKVIYSTVDGVEYAKCNNCEVNKTLDNFYEKTGRGCKECCKIIKKNFLNSPRGTLQQLLDGAKKHTKRREGTQIKNRDNSFDIDLNELIKKYNEQNGLCYYSGLPLKFGSYLETDWKVSLERLDVFKGYTKDNICLICLEFNASDKSVIYKDNTLGNSGWTKDKFQYFLTKVQEKYANENKAEV